jgi:hypothetical protein
MHERPFDFIDFDAVSSLSQPNMHKSTPNLACAVFALHDAGPLSG